MITPDFWDQLAARAAAVARRQPHACVCAACMSERARRAPEEDRAAETDLPRILADCRPSEVLVLRAALIRGVIDGRSYSTCVLGIVATLRGTTYTGSLVSPFELWLAARVHAGMTPHTHHDAARLDRWLRAWLEAHTLELAPTPAIWRKQAAPEAAE